MLFLIPKIISVSDANETGAPSTIYRDRLNAILSEGGEEGEKLARMILNKPIVIEFVLRKMSAKRREKELALLKLHSNHRIRQAAYEYELNDPENWDAVPVYKQVIVDREQGYHFRLNVFRKLFGRNEKAAMDIFNGIEKENNYIDKLLFIGKVKEMLAMQNG